MPQIRILDIQKIMELYLFDKIKQQCPKNSMACNIQWKNL